MLADVYESDLGRLPPAAEVTIRTDAYPDRTFTGRITYVSDTIEAATRAAHVRCVVENADDALKLGMFVSVTIPPTRGLPPWPHPSRRSSESTVSRWSSCRPAPPRSSAAT